MHKKLVCKCCSWASKDRGKALLRGISLSKYGSEGSQVRLKRLAKYGSVAHLLKDQHGKHGPNRTRTPFFISRIFKTSRKCSLATSCLIFFYGKWQTTHKGFFLADPLRSLRVPGPVFVVKMRNEKSSGWPSHTVRTRFVHEEKFAYGSRFSTWREALSWKHGKPFSEWRFLSELLQER